MPRLSSISASVRQLKNSHVPINRLPPEVLALVPTFRESEKDLINATAVCRHWRKTLTSTPNLWTGIICSETEKSQVTISHVQAYLERSGSVPVNVQTHAFASQLLSPHVGRISSLRLFWCRSWDFDEIAEHLSKPAPILEAISLHVWDWDHPTLVLPPTLSETLLSSVRTLDFHGATLSPGPCKLSRLTKFILETRVTTIVPSVVLLDTLETMPLLQFFEAKLSCARQPDPVPGDRVVTLPHLEEITIMVDGEYIGSLTIPILPALCLPGARRVSVRSINVFTVPPTPILPLSFEKRLPALRITSEVSVTLGNEFKLEFFGPDQPELTLSINTLSGFIFTQSTFGGAPFGSVRKLHACFQIHTLYSAVFVEVLRAMGGLEWLEMEDNTGRPLTHWAEADDQAGICPALITLIITDIDDREAERCVREVEQTRKRAGVPIAHVEIGYRYGSHIDGEYYVLDPS